MSGDQQRRSTHRYDLDGDEPPSRGVFVAVAEVRGCSPLDIPPLAETVDPDALDALLAGDDGTDEAAFEYCGHEVWVTADEVRVVTDDA